ncbi:uncharacterized protein LOC119111338, partial [Pollicipes pollicipes]|uniref:uncharacterized protein LOC119111338 n=1 Tax=Pollicipes pollicipes TaxID=41117 RepID=UPI001884A20B
MGRSSLADMEPTLIRNLSDHHGNNLAHVLAACGHVEALAWLVGTCGHVLSEALADENKHGMTPSVAAVRCGKLDVVQWMVENTIIRDRLLTREGERSLLHAAAKYGQVEITSWCADQLQREGQGVDLADHHGDTPLHLAAKTGNTAVAQRLLERNASVTARNDMSLKPYELAVHHGHAACAEYLLTHEALGDLAVDFTSLEAEAGRLQHENGDYKNNFREEPADEPPEQLDEASELANTLHVRWQHCQRAWFSAPLADTQHRLLVAEQAWKRLRASRKDNVSSMTSAQEIVRNKIGDLRAQSAQTRYLDSRALSSSENSLVDSELYQQISPQRQEPAASEIYGAKSLEGSDRRGQSVDKMERLSVSVTGGGAPAASSAGGLSRNLDLSKSLDFSDGALDGGGDEVHNSTFAARPRGGGAPDGAQDELRRQLRGLALVSDSGSASVLEVIEPTGSEAGSTVDLVQREIEAQRRARQARSRDSSRSRERRQEPAAGDTAKQLDQVRARRSTPNEDDSDFLGLRTGKPHRSRVASEAAKCSAYGDGVRRAHATADGRRSDGGASLASLVLSEPDILQGTRHTLDRAEEASPTARPEPAEPVAVPGQEETAAEEPDRVLFELEGGRAPAPDAAASGGKRRGFLQKFAMRTRWNSRKKERPWRAGQEISVEEFREMYQQEGRDVSVSSQDLSASEASSLEEKKRLSLVSHGEGASLSEASDAEHRSKRASVASKRESDSNEPPESPHKEAAAAAAAGSDPRSPAEPPADEVPRPASSASRPDSSASTFPPYKGFALAGAGALASELLPPPEGGAAGRHSPAPSEASKTESALSPPSHASDVSKTESTRHLNQLDKIEELRAESVQKLAAEAEETAAAAPE